MIIIAPYAKALRNGNNNPKNYPYWKELIPLIRHETIIQVGVSGEEQLVEEFHKDLNLKQLAELIHECRTWISVDSFFQHYAWDLGKPGIVLWGQSDPNIFGHPENINLLKDRKYLREKQFWLWEQTPYIQEAFVSPQEILKELNINK